MGLEHHHSTSSLSFWCCIPRRRKLVRSTPNRHRQYSRLSFTPIDTAPRIHVVMANPTNQIQINPLGKDAKKIIISVSYSPSAQHSVIPERLLRDAQGINRIQLDTPKGLIRECFHGRWTPDDGETCKSRLEVFYITPEDIPMAILRANKPAEISQGAMEAYTFALKPQNTVTRKAQEQKQKDRDADRNAKIVERTKIKEEQHKASKENIRVKQDEHTVSWEDASKVSRDSEGIEQTLRKQS